MIGKICEQHRILWLNECESWMAVKIQLRRLLRLRIHSYGNSYAEDYCDCCAQQTSPLYCIRLYSSVIFITPHNIIIIIILKRSAFLLRLLLPEAPAMDILRPWLLEINISFPLCRYYYFELLYLKSFSNIIAFRSAQRELPGVRSRIPGTLLWGAFRDVPRQCWTKAQGRWNHE